MRIIGTGSAHPKRTLTNDDLSQMMDTSDAWIRERTGICTRQIITDEELDELAAEAAQKALDDAGITASELDYIICSNVVNEYVTPSIASIVEGKIGALCPCVDLNAACTGFIYAMDYAEALLQSGRATNILVMAAEEPTRMVDWSDRSTCVLFGDGAGAAVLTPGDNIMSARLSAASATDKLWQYRKLQPTPYVTKEEVDTPLQMKGQEVFKFAVTAASDDITKALGDANVTPDEVDHYLLHQANIRIINAIQNYLRQPAEKFPTNVEDHGNSSSACCPILLDECNRKGLLKEGDIIAMSAFGAGFVSGAIVFKW